MTVMERSKSLDRCPTADAWTSAKPPYHVTFVIFSNADFRRRGRLFLLKISGKGGKSYFSWSAQGAARPKSLKFRAKSLWQAAWIFG
jgi:hypothetical protein